MKKVKGSEYFPNALYTSDCHFSGTEVEQLDSKLFPQKMYFEKFTYIRISHMVVGEFAIVKIGLANKTLYIYKKRVGYATQMPNYVL